MRWASAISDLPDFEAALGAALATLTAGLDGGARADLVIAFVSAHHAGSYALLPARIAAALPGALLVGCSVGGAIGAGHEVEDRPALSLTAASLPGVELTPLRFDAATLPDAADPPEAWRELVGLPVGDDAGSDPHFLLLPDPFTCDTDALVTGLDAAYPSGRKFGGLASGAAHPGATALFLAGTTYRAGAVGVALRGNIAVDTLVAQGCRAIGQPLPITHCEDNVVLGLGGRRPLEVLRDLFQSLDARDRGLFGHSLFLGLEMDESNVEYREGELLVRNIVGIDTDSGGLAIGAVPHKFQVAQFVLRDATTATDDLRRHLERYSRTGRTPRGALLFSCLGRGRHLFGAPDHDTDLFRSLVGPVPLGGFFCNGEIGPVGNTTFLHGYTSAFALFRENKD